MSARCGLGCGRPAPNGTICTQHTWELQRDLDAVPDLLADLDLTLARQGKLGPVTEKVKGKGETPVSFNPAASAAADHLRDVLVRWARLCGMPWAEYATTAAAHLLARLPELGTRGDLPTMADQIGLVVDAARRAVDAPAMRTVIPVGPCPETPDGRLCGGLVRAFIPADDRPAHMACDGEAAHVWSSIQWLRVTKRIRDLADRQARAARVQPAVFGREAG